MKLVGKWIRRNQFQYVLEIRGHNLLIFRNHSHTDILNVIMSLCVPLVSKKLLFNFLPLLSNRKKSHKYVTAINKCYYDVRLIK